MTLRIVHLLASPFVGGPERQVLGLARHLPAEFASSFLSFAEGGKAHAFLDLARTHGFESHALRFNFPHLRPATAEVAQWLRKLRADVVCTSGYKPDLIGWRAARQVGVPVVSISHGWTAATLKVRCYEALDRFMLRWMDAVVAVSQAQAFKVKAAGAAASKVVVIKNAVDAEPVAADPSHRRELSSWFAAPPRWIVGAAGRLSPEKGYDDFITAAAQVLRQQADVGFVLFGDGPLRASLERHVQTLQLTGRFVLAGFRDNVGQFLPHLDLSVMTSHTEGLPVILLECGAAGVPTIATAVGGIPEVIDDGVTGLLIPPGQPLVLAERIASLLHDEDRRRAMGQALQEKVRRQFTFEQQSQQYQALFRRLTSAGGYAAPRGAGPLPLVFPAPALSRK